MNGMEYRFKPGDVVYWHRQVGNHHFVDYGIVYDHYSDCVYVDLLTFPENRVIDGIPLNNFETPTPWKKLPKGWTYNTQLFTMGWDEPPKEVANLSRKNPDDIKRAYLNGFLIKASEKFDGSIETEITKQGWRIVRKYNGHTLRHVSLAHHKAYTTYEEAKAEVDAYLTELRRQSELSDYEWSVEQIDKELNRWQKLYGIPEDTKLAYREWLLQRPNVEDIEVRIYDSAIQWKYDRRKRWNNIEMVR